MRTEPESINWVDFFLRASTLQGLASFALYTTALKAERQEVRDSNQLNLKQ